MADHPPAGSVPDFRLLAATVAFGLVFSVIALVDLSELDPQPEEAAKVVDYLSRLSFYVLAWVGLLVVPAVVAVAADRAQRRLGHLPRALRLAGTGLVVAQWILAGSVLLARFAGTGAGSAQWKAADVGAAIAAVAAVAYAAVLIALALRRSEH